MQIVAIGASAGGIEAFRLFFEAMPADSGMGFVVVLHMSAERKSMLADIISRWTAMSVTEAADDDKVLPNQVYIIPPGNVGTLRDGRVHLRPLAADVPREATPIDQFFDSVAADLGEDAIGIVLSGTGHDGALGLKAIRALGGLTLAQARVRTH
jgi:two-component system CheB/CheR fusion protein